MSKATKIWLTVAASLVLLGIIIFTAIMTVNHWDFIKLSTEEFETRTYEFNEDFNSILISTDTAEIVFLPSENDKCRVVCYEPDSGIHDVTVKDGKLSINWMVHKKWYEHIGITVGSPKITVYLPHNEYVSLSIKESTGDVSILNNFKFDSIDITVSTGDINIENVTAGSIGIKVSTGDTFLTNVTCESLASTGSTGDITMSGVIASGKFSIERSTGDVKFDKCDAAEIFVLTDTGDVTGTLLSEKIFFPDSDTGKIDVPKTTSGGKCEITTDTGDIKIRIN